MEHVRLPLPSTACLAAVADFRDFRVLRCGPLMRSSELLEVPDRSSSAAGPRAIHTLNQVL